MEQHEVHDIEKYSQSDPTLKALWEEHMLYEKQIARLEAKAFLAPAEEQELKHLKKQKLDGKTKMLALLDKLKK